MRKSIIFLLLLSVILVTGCDFFRTLAGRPTSNDIDAKRVQIMKAEEAALQARLDSIRRVEEKVVADSIAALDSLTASGVIMADASRLGGFVTEDLGSRYHIVIGVFRERNNALKLADQAGQGGYPARLFDCRRGMIAVGICPSDKISRTYQDWKDLQGKTFCPKDSWILLNE